MNYNNILTEKADGIFTITINRPDKLNALNYETIQEIGMAVRFANDDDDVRGVVGVATAKDSTCDSEFPL